MYIHYLIVVIEVGGLPVLVGHTHTSILAGAVKEGPAGALFHYLPILGFVLVRIQVTVVLCAWAGERARCEQHNTCKGMLYMVPIPSTMDSVVYTDAL